MVQNGDGLLDADRLGQQPPQRRPRGVEVVDALAAGIDQEEVAIDRRLGHPLVAPEARPDGSIGPCRGDGGRTGGAASPRAPPAGRPAAERFLEQGDGVLAIGVSQREALRLADEGVQAAKDFDRLTVTGEMLQNHSFQHVARARRRQFRPRLRIAAEQHEAADRGVGSKRRQLVGAEIEVQIATASQAPSALNVVAECGAGAARQRQPQARRDAGSDAPVATPPDRQHVVRVDPHPGRREIRRERALSGPVRVRKDDQLAGELSRGAVQAEQRGGIGDVGPDQIDDEGAHHVDLVAVAGRRRSPWRFDGVALRGLSNRDDRRRRRRATQLRKPPAPEHPG